MRRFPLAALVLMLAAPTLKAQAIREWTLTGRLATADGKPIEDATIRVTQGPRTLVARSDGRGTYRVKSVGEGTWIVAVRRVGYRPSLDTIVFDPKGMRRDYTLERAATSLGAVVVNANWTGVRGVVGDIRLMKPLEGARVVVMSDRGTPVETDAEGRFAAPLAPGTEVVLRVERDGYLRRVVTAKVPPDGYIELDIPLDTLRGDARREFIAFEDLENRLAWASPHAAIVNRAELARSDASRLSLALRESGTLAAKGLLGSSGCLFVNGQAKPGFSVDLVPLEDVELVEVYPKGSDDSRTLSSRWPPREECRTFISVWTSVD